MDMQNLHGCQAVHLPGLSQSMQEKPSYIFCCHAGEHGSVTGSTVSEQPWETCLVFAVLADRLTLLRHHVARLQRLRAISCQCIIVLRKVCLAQS